MRLEQAMPDLIRVRVGRDEKRLLKDLAHQRGVSMSEFLRTTVAQAAVSEKASLDAIATVNQR